MFLVNCLCVTIRKIYYLFLKHLGSFEVSTMEESHQISDQNLLGEVDICYILCETNFLVHEGNILTVLSTLPEKNMGTILHFSFTAKVRIGFVQKQQDLQVEICF